MARKVLHRHTLSTSSTAPIAAARSSSTNSTASRREPVARKEPVKLQPKPSARFAEVAGGTAAECAAVCCCCPCGLAGLLFCALVKLPAGLCRRAILRKKRKIMRKKSVLLAMAAEEKSGTAKEKGEEEEERWVIPASAAPSQELEEMEREMWARFYGTGFWRSPSQREDR